MKKNNIIKQIKIIDYSPFKKETKLDNLKYVNIILGKNGYGKTRLAKLFLESQIDQKKVEITLHDNKQSRKKSEKYLIFNQNYIQEYFYQKDKNENLKAHRSIGSKFNVEIQKKMDGFETEYKVKKEEIVSLLQKKDFWNVRKLTKIDQQIKSMENWFRFKEIEQNRSITRLVKEIEKRWTRLIKAMIKKEILFFLDKEKEINFNTKNQEEFFNKFDSWFQKNKIESFLTDEKLKQIVKNTNLLTLLKNWPKKKEIKDQNQPKNSNGTKENLINKIYNKIKILEKLNNYKPITKNLEKDSFIIKMIEKNENYLNWLEMAIGIYNENGKEFKKIHKCLLCGRDDFRKEEIFKLENYFKKKKLIDFDNFNKELQQFQELKENEIKNLEIEAKEWGVFEEFDFQKINNVFEKFKEQIKNIKILSEEIQKIKKSIHQNVRVNFQDKIKNTDKAIEEVLIKINQKKINQKEILNKILFLFLIAKEKDYLKYKNQKETIIKDLKICLNKWKLWQNEANKIKHDEEIKIKINNVLDKCDFHFKLEHENNNLQYFYKISSKQAGNLKRFELSDGEKSVLSFLYFLFDDCEKQINKNKNRNYIIFIDDPTSNVTEENSDTILSEIINQIKNHYIEGNFQYIITSHKIKFVNKLWRWLKYSTIYDSKKFQIKQTTIKGIKESEFQEGKYKLWSFYHDNWDHWIENKNKNNILKLPNIMRQILEGFFVFWSKNDWKTFIKKLAENENDNSYLDLINTIDKYSHHQTFDNKEMAEKDIQKAIKTFENFFVKIDKMHFQQMVGEKTISKQENKTNFKFKQILNEKEETLEK